NSAQPGDVDDMGERPTVVKPASSNTPSRLFIIGDSHASQLLPAVDVWAMLQNDSVELTNLITTACPPIRQVTPYVGGYKQYGCSIENERAFKAIEAVSKRASGSSLGRTGVVLAARWTMYLAQSNVSLYEPWIGRIDSDTDTAEKS